MKKKNDILRCKRCHFFCPSKDIKGKGYCLIPLESGRRGKLDCSRQACVEFILNGKVRDEVAFKKCLDE